MHDINVAMRGLQVFGVGKRGLVGSDIMPAGVVWATARHVVSALHLARDTGLLSFAFMSDSAASPTQSLPAPGICRGFSFVRKT